MNSQQKMSLLKVQELGFAAIELNLFLDTHPNSIEALREYNRVSEELQIAVKEYEQRYGPLMAFGHSTSSYPWQWVEEPWPWEI